jgi:hypothetical protein
MDDVETKHKGKLTDEQVVDAAASVSKSPAAPPFEKPPLVDKGPPTGALLTAGDRGGGYTHGGPSGAQNDLKFWVGRGWKNL